MGIAEAAHDRNDWQFTRGGCVGIKFLNLEKSLVEFKSPGWIKNGDAVLVLVIVQGLEVSGLQSIGTMSDDDNSTWTITSRKRFTKQAFSEQAATVGGQECELFCLGDTLKSR